jgi:hypothetical protein
MAMMALHPEVSLASLIMWVYAEHHGANCGVSTAELLIVCGGATSGFGGGGTNYGFVHVTGHETQDVLNPNSVYYVGELHHEGVHSWQDGVFGLGPVFLFRTGGEAVTGLDPKYDFGDGCHDLVEIDAGLEAGHYTSCG